jgi:Domain of unknown function (DUF4276)
VKELYVFCEGTTEQGFCNQILAPHIFPNHDGIVHTLKTVNNKHHDAEYRGGLLKYASFKRGIENELKRHRARNVYFTTLIDLYGLPGDFPGKADHVRDANNPAPYVEALEAAFGREIGNRRFIPHLQLHEFETMLFANLDAFRQVFEKRNRELAALKKVVDAYPSIEHINDGASTAPSKRIIALFPEYEVLKSSAGPTLARLIGLAAIRAKCPHFNKWVLNLESLDWDAK